MNTDTIQSKLDALAELLAASDALALKKADLVKAAVPPEVAARLAEIDAEFGDKFAAASARIGEAEAEIKAAVAALGESVKGARLHAVYSKARITWDSRGLDGYAVAHPEIAAFRREGQPSVSIKAVKNG